MTAYKLDLVHRRPRAHRPRRPADRPRPARALVPDRRRRLRRPRPAARGRARPRHARPRSPRSSVRAEGLAPFQTTTYLLEYYDEVYRALERHGRARAQRQRHLAVQAARLLQGRRRRHRPAGRRRVLALHGRHDRQDRRGRPRHLSFGQHRRLLDLCGNTGNFCAAIVAATPGLPGAFLDVPACVAIGRRQLAARPELAGRVERDRRRPASAPRCRPAST